MREVVAVFADEFIDVVIGGDDDEIAGFWVVFVGFVFDGEAAGGFEEAAFDDDAEPVEVAAFVDFGGVFVEGECPFWAVGDAEDGDDESHGGVWFFLFHAIVDGADLFDGFVFNDEWNHGGRPFVWGCLGLFGLFEVAVIDVFGGVDFAS